MIRSSRRGHRALGALTLLQACTFQGSIEGVCDRAVDARAEALYLGSADGGSLGLASSARSAIGGVVLGDGDDAPIVCTATVIAPGVALTAAHCAGAGAIALRLSNDSHDLPIRETTPHPRLDVMLVRFDAHASEAATPIGVFDGSIGAAWKGKQVTLAGVGRTETGSTGELRFVREPIVDVSETELRVDGMGRSGACGGDSGGPLLIETGDGAMHVAGVLDRGAPSCLGIDVFVRVDAFADWLDVTLGERTALGPCPATPAHDP